MKMNLIVSILCALLLGYLCASFLLNRPEYADSVFHESEMLYFLHYDLNQKPESIAYLDLSEGDKPSYYVGITTLSENAEKIRSFYEKKGILVSVEQKKVENPSFVSELSQYDILLKSTKTDEEMYSVLSTILSSYHEFVLDS